METKKIKCPHCGEQTSADLQRCEICGELINNIDNGQPMQESSGDTNQNGCGEEQKGGNSNTVVPVITIALLVVIVGLLLFSVFKKEEAKWEYKTVRVEGTESGYLSDFSPKSFSDQTGQLNSLGKEGWELVDVYTETETKHCNFGKDEYVTGIQPNVRTTVITYILKKKTK